ncbi:hypothetical protein DM860_013663 [Cuscuta australis]|uniref:Uncharacterized protein n=1 Tax=Cuscuta australis TaxID=267555 RepID=A0A328EB07_9ASTE|nr:hypothetical protein DM860_013663 [Cuscuta australis]
METTPRDHVPNPRTRFHGGRDCKGARAADSETLKPNIERNRLSEPRILSENPNRGSKTKGVRFVHILNHGFGVLESASAVRFCRKKEAEEQGRLEIAEAVGEYDAMDLLCLVDD